MLKIMIITAIIGLFIFQLQAQKLLPFQLQETGQTIGYSSMIGEDPDYVINPQSFTDNDATTITDNNTGLMWQNVDGGEMIYENAATYCKALTLGACLPAWSCSVSTTSAPTSQH